MILNYFSLTGLRILSEKVRDIVCELKETTYKQVAEHLIKDMEATKQNNLEFVDNLAFFPYETLEIIHYFLLINIIFCSFISRRKMNRT